MKLVILALAVSVAAAAKLDQLEQHAQQHTQEHVQQHAHQPVRPVVAIIRDDRIAPSGASYSTDFETEDGVVLSENGQAGSAGQSNVQGSYSYVSPEGELIQVTYVADEFGFRAEGPHVPTPHPLPVHAQQQIAFAKELERLRAQEQLL